MVKFKRIFLITVDCLRADHVGCIGGGALTPNIDRLSRDSIVFTRAFANGPGTNQSFPAILTSTYFLMHGGLRLNPHYFTLAEVFSKHGFRTVAFHSNPFLSAKLGWNKGFREFYDFMNTIKSPSAFITKQHDKWFTKILVHFASTMLRGSKSSRIQCLLKKIYYRSSGLELPYLEGSRLNEHVITWIKRNKKEKFFLWMHYMDPHDPYIPPEEYLVDFSTREEALEFNLSIDTNNLSDEELAILKRLYQGEVKYTDFCIGEFIYYLEDEHLLDDSLIIITGDHGHAFMEHGRYAHAYDILYNEVIHVPLIIFGIGDNQRIDSYVQLLDLPPTILQLVGIMKPSTFLGKSIFDAIGESRIIFSESAKPDLINLRYDLSKKVISCIRGKFKLILNEFKGAIELYDLEKDFVEKNDLSEKEREISGELLHIIHSHLFFEKSFKMRIKLKAKEKSDML